MAVQPKLLILADAYLLKLYSKLHKGDKGTSMEALAATFGSKVKSSIFEFAIADLYHQGTATTNSPRDTIWITKSGYLKVEKELENKNSFFSIYSEKGDDWLFETGGVIDDREADASSKSATEDAWEPLPLDRQNPALDQAIEKIDELIQAITQDNGYAANEPDERNYILSALRAGARALRDQTVIYRMQFKAFIWEPLKQIATRFGPSAIGLLADAAKESIKEAFKHVAKKFLDNW